MQILDTCRRPRAKQIATQMKQKVLKFRQSAASCRAVLPAQSAQVSLSPVARRCCTNSTCPFAASVHQTTCINTYQNCGADTMLHKAPSTSKWSSHGADRHQHPQKQHKKLKLHFTGQSTQIQLPITNLKCGPYIQPQMNQQINDEKRLDMYMSIYLSISCVYIYIYAHTPPPPPMIHFLCVLLVWIVGGGMNQNAAMLEKS